MSRKIVCLYLFPYGFGIEFYVWKVCVNKQPLRTLSVFQPDNSFLLSIVPGSFHLP